MWKIRIIESFILMSNVLLSSPRSTRLEGENNVKDRSSSPQSVIIQINNLESMDSFSVNLDS